MLAPIHVPPASPLPPVTQPKREPRPKKPRTERPASDKPSFTEYEDDDGDDDPLAMEDDAADEDFDLAAEVGGRVAGVILLFISVWQGAAEVGERV